MAYDDSGGSQVATGTPVELRPGAGALRAARTLVVGVPLVASAVAAHHLAHGCVDALGVLTTSAVLLTASWTQLARERSAAFFLVWLSLGQALAHGLLAVTCTDVGRAATASPARGMLLAHAVGTLVTAAALRRGEVAVWSLSRRLQRLSGLVARWAGPCPCPVVAVPAPLAVPAPWSAPRPRSLDSVPRPARRGPPVAARSCA
jgi:hypothetical protein